MREWSSEWLECSVNKCHLALKYLWSASVVVGVWLGVVAKVGHQAVAEPVFVVSRCIGIQRV